MFGTMSGVQALNLTLLQTVRDYARADLAEASCRFGMPAEQLRRIRDLPAQGMINIVASMGEEPLFAPREDLDALLKAPSQVTATWASARGLVPSKAPDTSSRL